MYCTEKRRTCCSRDVILPVLWWGQAQHDQIPDLIVNEWYTTIDRAQTIRLHIINVNGWLMSISLTSALWLLIHYVTESTKMSSTSWIIKHAVKKVLGRSNHRVQLLVWRLRKVPTKNSSKSNTQKPHQNDSWWNYQNHIFLFPEMVLSS